MKIWIIPYFPYLSLFLSRPFALSPSLSLSRFLSPTYTRTGGRCPLQNTPTLSSAASPAITSLISAFEPFLFDIETKVFYFIVSAFIREWRRPHPFARDGKTRFFVRRAVDIKHEEWHKKWPKMNNNGPDAFAIHACVSRGALRSAPLRSERRAPSVVAIHHRSAFSNKTNVGMPRTKRSIAPTHTHTHILGHHFRSCHVFTNRMLCVGSICVSFGR